MVTGRMRAMVTCTSPNRALVSLLTNCAALKDCELLLQEYHLYWNSLVVPDLLLVEFTIVSSNLCVKRHQCLHGCSVLEYTYLLFWNVFWTIAPVIGIGLFDRLIGKQACFLGIPLR